MIWYTDKPDKKTRAYFDTFDKGDARNFLFVEKEGLTGAKDKCLARIYEGWNTGWRMERSEVKEIAKRNGFILFSAANFDTSIPFVTVIQPRYAYPAVRILCYLYVMEYL